MGKSREIERLNQLGCVFSQNKYRDIWPETWFGDGSRKSGFFSFIVITDNCRQFGPRIQVVSVKFSKH